MSQNDSPTDSVFPPPWRIELGAGPLVGLALHDGHAVRPEANRWMSIDAADRLREEDPYTAAWAAVAPTRIVVARSRFEMDLNRPRHRAVYRRPEDAWGLIVWRESPPEELLERTLAQYDRFYAEVERVLSQLVERHGLLAVLDLHAYNHRRRGSNAPADDPQTNPDIDLGTATLDRRRWAPLVDRFTAEVRAADFFGRRLDIRENIRFQGGGHFSEWARCTFGDSVCCLSIEVKKFFMDEWTGKLDAARHDAFTAVVRRAAAGMVEELARLPR